MRNEELESSEDAKTGRRGHIYRQRGDNESTRTDSKVQRERTQKQHLANSQISDIIRLEHLAQMMAHTFIYDAVVVPLPIVNALLAASVRSESGSSSS